jgi:hypothetical protein
MHAVRTHVCCGGDGHKHHRSRLQLLLSAASASSTVLHRCSSMSAVLGMAAIQPDDSSDQKSETHTASAPSLAYELVRNGLGPAFDSWSLVESRSTELVVRTAPSSSCATAAGGLTAPQASLQSFLSSIVPLILAFPLQRYVCT